MNAVPDDFVPAAAARAAAPAPLPALLLRHDRWRRRAGTAPIRGWCCRSCARSRASTRARSRPRPRAGCSSSSSRPRATSARRSASWTSRRRTSTTRASSSASAPATWRSCRSSSAAIPTRPPPPTTRGRTRCGCGRARPRPRRRRLLLHRQLRGDEELRAQGPQQLRALRRDLRGPGAGGRDPVGGLPGSKPSRCSFVGCKPRASPYASALVRTGSQDT